MGQPWRACDGPWEPRQRNLNSAFSVLRILYGRAARPLCGPLRFLRNVPKLLAKLNATSPGRGLDRVALQAGATRTSVIHHGAQSPGFACPGHYLPIKDPMSETRIADAPVHASWSSSMQASREPTTKDPRS